MKNLVNFGVKHLQSAVAFLGLQCLLWHMAKVQSLDINTELGLFKMLCLKAENSLQMDCFKEGIFFSFLISSVTTKEE